MVQKKGLVRYTPKTVVDPKQFLREIELVKKQGYAVDDEEYIRASEPLLLLCFLLPLPQPPFGGWIHFNDG